jgi:hypothetical protein
MLYVYKAHITNGQPYKAHITNGQPNESAPDLVCFVIVAAAAAARMMVQMRWRR